GFPLPSREILLQLCDQVPDGEHEAASWLAFSLRGTPGLLEATETLLIEYANAVRAERTRRSKAGQYFVDTPLPDDHEVGPLLSRLMIPESTRIDRAIEAILAYEGNYKDVAARFGIGQKRFLKILHDRGLSRRPGGYWRLRDQPQIS